MANFTNLLFLTVLISSVVNEVFSNKHVDRRLDRSQHHRDRNDVETATYGIRHNRKLRISTAPPIDLSSKNLERKSWKNKNSKNEIIKEVDQYGSSSSRFGSPDPEVNKRLAGIARYIVHHFDWGVMGTISSRIYNPGNPVTTTKSVSDGDWQTSTGQPYFYMSPDYFSSKDLAEDFRVSFTMSMDNKLYCHEHGWDIQDPQCHWVMMTGNFTKVPEGTEEHDKAWGYLLARHPHFANYPKDYFIGTIDLFDVMVQAGKNELECIPLDAYFNTPPNSAPEA